MFKRRRGLTILQKLKELLWPSMGWIRATLYAKHRLLRLSSSTHTIATGLACGACVSFTPFFGFHFLIALGYARIMGGHYLASIIGTFMGNPWTFPFLLWSSFHVGKFVLASFGVDIEIEPQSDDIDEIQESFLTFFMSNFWDFYIPTALGGLICMILSWPLFYAPAYLIVRAGKSARRRHLKRKYKKKWKSAAANHANESGTKGQEACSNAIEAPLNIDDGVSPPQTPNINEATQASAPTQKDSTATTSPKEGA